MNNFGSPILGSLGDSRVSASHFTIQAQRSTLVSPMERFHQLSLCLCSTSLRGFQFLAAATFWHRFVCRTARNIAVVLLELGADSYTVAFYMQRRRRPLGLGNVDFLAICCKFNVVMSYSASIWFTVTVTASSALARRVSTGSSASFVSETVHRSFTLCLHRQLLVQPEFALPTRLIQMNPQRLTMRCSAYEGCQLEVRYSS